MFKYETLIVNDDHDDNNNHDLFQCVQSQSKFQFFLLLWAMSAIDVLWKWNANVCIGGENTLGIIIKIMWKNSKLLPFRMLNNRAHLVFILSRSATTIFTLQHVFNVFLFEYIFFSLCLHLLSLARALPSISSVLFAWTHLNALHFHSMFCGTEKLTWISTILM